MKKPYLSVVIVARNDDYGDNFLLRINTFIKSLDHQVARHAGIFELVIVEWNPLPDRSPLADVLPNTKNLQVRIITVSNQLHSTIGSDSPVLEFHGKNVGIRRARGEYVLVTNPDIIFSQNMIDELAKKKLRLDTVYRTDRYDFRVDGIEQIDAKDLEDFALRNTFVVHGMAGNASVSEPVDQDERSLDLLPRSGISADVLHTNACGDFLLAGKELFFTVRGMYETLQHRWHLDSISLARFQAAQIKQHVFLAPCCIFHQHHDRKPQDVEFISLDIKALASKPGDPNWGFPSETLPEIGKDPA